MEGGEGRGRGLGELSWGAVDSQATGLSPSHSGTSAAAPGKKYSEKAKREGQGGRRRRRLALGVSQPRQEECLGAEAGEERGGGGGGRRLFNPVWPRRGIKHQLLCAPYPKSPLALIRDPPEALCLLLADFIICPMKHSLQVPALNFALSGSGQVIR